MLGSSEKEHFGDCRLCAQSLVAAVLPGGLGSCGPAVPSLVSVSWGLARPARESPAYRPAATPFKVDPPTEKTVRPSGGAPGRCGSRSAQPGDGAVCSFPTA